MADFVSLGHSDHGNGISLCITYSEIVLHISIHETVSVH